MFNDVNNLFEEDGILNEYPLRIKFNNEKAFDCGGVCRDMFSAYWEEAYSQFFDGSALLTPVLHPGVDMSVLPSLGTVLSHGYLVCGFIPTRIAFPVLASIFLGSEVKIPKRILIESFAECLSSIEAGVVKNALISTDKDFSPETKANLISILSQYGCRVCPTPGTLLLQLANTAHFEFQIKPLAVSRTIANGIPLDEKAFWESYSVEQLYSLYFALNATPQRILSVIEEPEVENESQARVFIYLKKFIGNMKSEELRRFLRFVTGTSVLLPEGIIICFNSNSGLMRRPIVHTCSCSLELPTTYVSYLDFEHEFHTILSSDDEYTWMMDAV